MTINDEQLNTAEEMQQEYLTTDAANENGSAVKQKHSKAEIVLNVALWVAIVVLLIAVVLRLFVFSTVEVDGDSMNPTYHHQDVVTVNKAASPNRGDVVVFYLNEVENKFLAQFAKREECQPGQPYEKLIKRVVALGGDRIWTRRAAENDGDILYELVIDTADGNRIYEDYYVKKGETLDKTNYYIHTFALSGLGNLDGYTEDKPLVISDGCFFAMGDNRVNSKDSRELGEFKLSQIFGVVLDK